MLRFKTGVNPGFPGHFDSYSHALILEGICNYEHRHSGIGYLTLAFLIRFATRGGDKDKKNVIQLDPDKPLQYNAPLGSYGRGGEKRIVSLVRILSRQAKKERATPFFS